MGLAPRLNGGRGGGSVAMLGANVNFTHYQSIQNLPTLNEVNEQNFNFMPEREA